MPQTLLKVREPENQYQFKEKERYREVVWDAFSKNVKDVATAKVLFFPSRHGAEIPIALRHGFKEENLIACDSVAAVIANAEWHRQYPAIKCYGSSLARTIERLKNEGVKLDAANLDLCSNLCSQIFSDLDQLFNSDITNYTFTFALTMLKGRENQSLADVARLSFELSDGTIDRLDIVKAYIEQRLVISCKTLLKSEYRSDTKMMCYGIFQKGYVGEIKRDKNYQHLVWSSCPDCGEERWVQTKNGDPQHARCKPCSAKSRITAIKRNCLTCGKEFLVEINKIKVGVGKYCSRKCYSGAGLERTKCINCGKEFCHYKSQHSVFCSVSCRMSYHKRTITKNGRFNKIAK